MEIKDSKKLEVLKNALSNYNKNLDIMITELKDTNQLKSIRKSFEDSLEVSKKLLEEVETEFWKVINENMKSKIENNEITDVIVTEDGLLYNERQNSIEKNLNKDIKTRLKERLLEISYRQKALREKYEREIGDFLFNKHELSRFLNIDIKELEALLNELVQKNILIEVFQYQCKECNETNWFDNETFVEESSYDGNNGIKCDNCDLGYIYDNDKTGFVYYNIVDENLLSNW